MDDRLKFYEREWKKEHSSRLDCEKQLDNAARQLQETQRKNIELQAQVGSLTHERDRLREELHERQEEVKQLRQHHLDIEEQLRQLRQSITEPGFWLEAFAIPFVKELELFDALPEVARHCTSGDPTDLAIATAQLISELEDGFDANKAAKLHRVLMAQWVYARWLEITALSKEL